jgi:hypothetical protein
MLHVNYDKWDQTPAMLRLFAVEAPHARTRERYQAVYEITQGLSASEVARRSGREDETVQRWVHSYNEGGPERLIYRRSGGRPPFARSWPPRWPSNSNERSSATANPP